MIRQATPTCRSSWLHRLAILAGLACLCAAAAAGAEDWTHPGMLRVRDLSPFGLLRLDPRPPQWADTPVDTWTIELELSYQNTFVMSGNVYDYLRKRGIGRAPLRPEDAVAIQELPGDAYYIDGEAGLFELLAHRKLDEHWTIYFTVPYLTYGSNLLDRPIEEFHKALNFDLEGRDLVARNRSQLVYDIGGIQSAQLNRAVSGGFGDPQFGVSYSWPRSSRGWDVVAEVSAKIAVDGRRPQLSTGRNDYGLQVGLRRSWGRHAAYFAGSAVYFAGEPGTPAISQIVPTLHAAYGYGLSRRTNLMLQAYASRGTVRHTNLREPSDNEYQLSLGFHRRTPRLLWSLAMIENVSNFNNTPDIVLQLGVAYPVAGS